MNNFFGAPVTTCREALRYNLLPPAERMQQKDFRFNPWRWSAS